MINKKLDDILQDISILKDIFNNNEYFKKIEEATERQNKWNNELVEKINNLQSKIDKVIEVLNKKHEEDKEIFKGDYDFKFILDFEEELLDILKEDK